MKNLGAAIFATFLVVLLQGCATVASISSYRSGSDDPLIYGGTRHWAEFLSGKMPGEGTGKAQLAMGLFPPLRLIPFFDGLLSLIADTALLPITTPWALTDALSSATVADRFDATIQKIKTTCAGRKLAPNEVCSGDVYKVNAADTLATEEGRFAHSIVIPKENQAESELPSLRNSQEHFDYLCKAFAGEFIHRTVDNIDGVLQLRPHLRSPYASEHLYAAEDPYGVTSDFSPGGLFAKPSSYSFLEAPQSALEALKQPHGSGIYRDSIPLQDKSTTEGKYVRYTLGYDGRYWTATQKAYSPAPKSRYGYTWRGITRPQDRALGIAGSELIVLDLQTSEVLGIFRGFTKFEFTRVRGGYTGMAWTKRCPSPSPSGMTPERDFVPKVLRPATIKN